MVKLKTWIPLFTTQFLGVLNDNILKNAIIFISIFWLAKEDQSMVIPVASALLVLPFVLFSPLAGKWSQTKSKQRIFEIAKLLEIPIMAVAVLGFYLESIHVVMTAMLLMGVQSAIYSPSKYGLIRDIGGVEGVSFGIGTMELLTFVGVLIGQVMAGLISDLPENSVLIVSIVMLALAVLGWISSRAISANEPEPTKTIRETINPLKYVYQSYQWSKKVKGLNYTIFGLGSFWLVASMLQMNIYMHAPDYYGMSNTETSIVMALIAIGIGFGCWVAGLIAKNRVEIGMVPLGGLALSICLTIFATVELSSTSFIILLFIAAFFSGFYKVPLNAWLQERVEGRKLGSILAYNNMVAFLFILIAAGIFGLVTSYFDTLTVFIFIAGISWLMTLVTMFNIPAMMIRFVADSMAKLYFKYDVTGSEYIPKKTGALLIANHQSLLDSLIIVAAVPRMMRFVMAREIYENPLIHWLVKRMNVIPVKANMGKDRLEDFARLCQEEINNGHLVCIFPEGQVSRIGHLLEFKKGVEHIAKGIDAPIIPLQLSGIDGTPFSFEVGSSEPIVSLRSFRKSISVNIGKPIHHHQSAFHLRQRVQELTAETFERRINHDHTLGHFFQKATIKNDSTAIVAGDAALLNYDELLRKSNALSNYLSETFEQGEKVGICIQSGVKAVQLNVAMAMAGITSIQIDPAVIESDQIDVSKKCDALIGEEESGLKLTDGLKFYNTKDVLEIAVKSDQSANKSKKLQKGDLAAIVYEQDEQGKWIEVALSHQNVLASVKGLSRIFDVEKDKRILSTIPMYSAYGYTFNTWLPLLTGMTMIHTPEDADIDGMARTIVDQKVNILFGINETIHQLYQTEISEVWKSIDTVVTGQDLVDPKVMELLHNEYDISIFNSLGFTSFGTVVAVNSPNYRLKGLDGKAITQKGTKDDSYGRPVPGMAIKVVDPKNHNEELGANEFGELLIKGAGLANSSNGSATNALEWIRSGFQGAIDQDGFLFLKKQS